MTARTWLLAGAGALAALVVAFFAGRQSAPTKVVETAKAAETISAAASASSSTAVVTAQASDKDTRKVVRRVVTKRDAPAVAAAGPCPACPAVHEEIVLEEDVDETSDEEGTLAGSSQVAATTSSAETSRSSETTRTVETSRPRWAVQARGAWVALELVPDHYGAELQLRVLGPLWLGAGVERSTEVRPTLSARLEF